jgi:hypothetical protein
MHQVEGDLGGGVNISANLVYHYSISRIQANVIVGNFETCIFVFGSERLGRKGC